MKILITGSNGLIGGAAVEYFDAQGHEVHGADNNWRAKFFGKEGDTTWNRSRVFHNCKNYHPNDTDVTNPDQVWSLFHRGDRVHTVFKYDAVIHCAAQPSHDFANTHEELDYAVNVKGTENLLECVRKYNPEAVFIFMSTNKVYDDAVNSKMFREFPSRYDFLSDDMLAEYCEDWRGFDESIPVGASNIFGRHKLTADGLTRAYAREYGLKTMVLRGGCLTGPGHSGVPMHGFLNYLIRCAVTGTKYQVNGYKGKQVRDNIHSYDVATALDAMIRNPRPGEVYNIGGGRENSISILEAIEMVEKMTGKKMDIEILDKPREGDHVCYITDMSKFRRDYPEWKMTKSLDDIFHETLRLYYWGTYSDHEDTKTYDLNENSTVWDVGGYRGAFTASLLEKYDPYVRVFEPIEEFYEDCNRRFANNRKVQVIRYGLSNQTKAITISKQGMNSSIIRGGDGQPKLPVDAVYGEPVEETVFMLDIVDYLEYSDVEGVDLISLNCEGGEYDILDRLIKTGDINKFNNVQVQFHDFHPDAVSRRDRIREELKKTHTERFNYPFVWESWKRK